LLSNLEIMHSAAVELRPGETKFGDRIYKYRKKVDRNQSAKLIDTARLDFY